MIDLSNATEAELIVMGFQYYKLNTNDKILLIPEQLYHRIPNGTLVFSINGNQCIKGKDYIDMDTRGGYLAYGLGKDYVREFKINNIIE